MTMNTMSTSTLDSDSVPIFDRKLRQGGTSEIQLSIEPRETNGPQKLKRLHVDLQGTEFVSSPSGD